MSDGLRGAFLHSGAAMNLTVFGAGYVGLVTAACFAEKGSRVVCVDVDAGRVADLERGVLPVHEPGLAELLSDGRRGGGLTFTTDAAAGVAHGDILFIAVATPRGEDGSADIGHVLDIAASIGRHMDAEKLVVVKSTVPVGAAERVRRRIDGVLEERDVSVRFDVVSNPEFLKEGAAVADFMKPDRVVIGSDSLESARTLEALYARFNRNRHRVVHMGVRSAELTKYAANAMLASRISLMNELANLAERLDADIDAVRRGIGSDRRIGPHFIYPGVGYGGSCLAKDIRALIRTAEHLVSKRRCYAGVEAVNVRQKELLFDKMQGYFKDGLAGRTLALVGTGFQARHR